MTVDNQKLNNQVASLITDKEKLENQIVSHLTDNSS